MGKSYNEASNFNNNNIQYDNNSQYDKELPQ